MKLNKFEKILLSIAVVAVVVTGLVLVITKLPKLSTAADSSRGFNFQKDVKTLATSAVEEYETPDTPEQDIASNDLANSGTEAGAVSTNTIDPRNALPTIPAEESDIERIQRLIKPLEDGEPGVEYLIRVFKDKQLVTVFTDPEGTGNFDYLIHAFRASTALPPHDTPSGEHSVGLKIPSGYMIDGSYGQYCSEFLEYHYLHALPSYGGVEESGVSWEDFNKLGHEASHGCVRLETRAAKWIYDNCPEGTRVEVLDSSVDFPYVPDSVDHLEMSEDGPSWDPTNPNPLNPYQKDPSILLPYNKQS